MKINNKTVQRTWIREDTLTMLLAIPLVLCITYKDIKNNGANNTIKKSNVIHVLCTCTAYCKCQTCGLTSAGRGHEIQNEAQELQ